MLTRIDLVFFFVLLSICGVGVYFLVKSWTLNDETDTETTAPVSTTAPGTTTAPVSTTALVTTTDETDFSRVTAAHNLTFVAFIVAPFILFVLVTAWAKRIAPITTVFLISVAFFPFGLLVLNQMFYPKSSTLQNKLSTVTENQKIVLVDFIQPDRFKALGELGTHHSMGYMDSGGTMDSSKLFLLDVPVIKTPMRNVAKNTDT